MSKVIFLFHRAARASTKQSGGKYKKVGKSLSADRNPSTSSRHLGQITLMFYFVALCITPRIHCRAKEVKVATGDREEAEQAGEKLNKQGGKGGKEEVG